jgi:hypothetical protein
MLLHYKDQALDTAHGNNAYCTRYYIMWKNSRLFNVKADCVYTKVVREVKNVLPYKDIY